MRYLLILLGLSVTANSSDVRCESEKNTNGFADVYVRVIEKADEYYASVSFYFKPWGPELFLDCSDRYNRKDYNYCVGKSFNQGHAVFKFVKENGTLKVYDKEGKLIKKSSYLLRCEY